jgi:ABC-type tungstate transport system substrate-binding protein
VLETRQGAFDMALALAFVLLGITFMINLLMLRLQGRVA